MSAIFPGDTHFGHAGFCLGPLRDPCVQVADYCARAITRRPPSRITALYRINPLKGLDGSAPNRRGIRPAR